MRQKKVKKLRKKMKENGFDIKAPAQYKVAHKVKKIAYFRNVDKNGLVTTSAVPVERKVIVNITKLPYRRLKKQFQLRTKGLKNVKAKK